MSDEGNGELIQFPGTFPEPAPDEVFEIEQQVWRVRKRLGELLGSGLYAKTETSLGKLEVFWFEGVTLAVHDDPQQANLEVFWIESDKLAEAHVRKPGPGLPEDLEAEHDHIVAILSGEMEWEYHDAVATREVADYFDALVVPQ